MAANQEIKLLEKCRVAPPPPDADTDTDTDAAEFTLPLTFYDLQFLVFHPCQHVHFYRFHHSISNPCTSTHSIIISLKSSLSLALKHFLPLAGNLICPSIDYSGDHHRMPELRYMKGDSVSLTIAESKEDFDYLVGDHQRDSSKFHSLLPQLPEPFVTSDDVQVSPVLALQVTMFPNSGVSIGHTFLHAVGDGSAFMNFNKLWTSINKFNEDSLELLQASSRPLYDRSVVQDPFNLGRKIFNEVKLLKSYNTPRIPSPKISKDEVRATFILHRSDIMKLKSSISNNVSTFNVTCALIWTCLSKSLDVVTEGKVEEDKCENICVFINCRERFDPPIPHNYFGNCVVPCIVGLTHGQLVGNEGLSIAATAIRDAIHKRVRDNEGILRGDWFSYSHTRSAAVTPGKLVIVGSIHCNGSDYNDNFGWGELVKHEWVSANDSSANVSFLTLSGRFEGAIEIGISLPKNRMDAFTTSCKICVNGPI